MAHSLDAPPSRPRRRNRAPTSVLPVIESETPLCPARYRRLALVDREPSALQSTETGGATTPFETRVLSAAQRKQMDLAGRCSSNRLKERALTKCLKRRSVTVEQLKTRADWERFPRSEVEGLWPVSSAQRFRPRTPLQTQVSKEFQGRGYRRQDLMYQSRPGMWVPRPHPLPAPS